MGSEEHLRETVEAAVRAEVAGPGALLAVEPASVRPGSQSRGQSFVLRFEGGTLEAYLKIHRRRGRGFEQECVAWAEEEFRLLSALHSLAAPPLAVVRPLALIPTLPGILFERHPGVTLNELLKQGRLGFGSGFPASELRQIYRLAGSSLAQLHGLLAAGTPLRSRLDAYEMVEIGLEEKLEETEKMLNRVLDHCRAAHRAVVESKYRYARRAFLDAVERPYPQAGVHGDFTPVNMFVHEGRPALFDFVNFHLGHPFEDVSRFLSYTRFLRKDPLSAASQEVGPLCEAFMEGYALPGWQSDPVLLFFFLSSMFRTLSGGLRYQSRPWPLSIVYTRAMRRALDDWIAEGMGLP